MKNQQRAKSKPRLTLREQYRQMAIRIIKKESTKILDIQTLKELIEMELDRTVKTDELIAAFKRKDCGLEITTQLKTTWVIFHKQAQTATEENSPETAKVPARRGRKPAKPKETEGKKISPAEFTLQAIQDLRKPPHKGIHTVYSGFNAAFRKYFPDLDPVQTATELSEKGIVVNKLTRGGALLYIPGETPKAKTKKKKGTKKAKIDKGDEALKKMGLA